MDFLILGPLTVVRDGTELSVTSAKIRTVLALLLINARQVVPPSALIDELWPEQPPPSATNTLQTYISQLRRLIGASTGSPAPLLTRPGGYLLEVPPDAIDSFHFEESLSSGRQAIENGDHGRAAARLRDGLGLWRGTALADVPGPAATREATRLEQLRLSAQELRITADLALGQHASVVGELQQLLLTHRWREELVAQLMTALYRCNRQADALSTFREFRSQLVEELGVEPAPELQRLYRQMLNHDDALHLPTGPAPAPDLPEAVGNHRSTPEPGEDAVSTAPATRREGKRMIAAAIGLPLTIATITVITQQTVGGTDKVPATTPALAVSLGCTEAGCRTTGHHVRVNAQVRGAKPADRELYLMVYSHGDDAWFIFYAITPDSEGRWSNPLRLGNTNPQPRDRLFTLCVDLLPADAVETLKNKQVSRQGKGLRASDLPSPRQQLGCVSAVRPAGD